MNGDTMLRQLAEADQFAPEHDLPDTARTSAVALTEIRRRIDIMDAKELTRPVEEEPKQRSGWFIAGLAFAGIVLVAGFVALMTDRGANEQSEEPVPTTRPLATTTLPATTSTADSSAASEIELELIAAFAEAWNSGNRQALEAIVDDTATMAVMPWSNPEEFQWMVDLMRSHRLMQSEMSIDSCRRSGDKLNCSIRLDGPVEEALSQGSMEYRGLFLLSDDRVLSIEAQCVVCPPLNTFDDVRKWVGTLDQEIANQMARIPFEPHSPDSARLWKDFAPMWAESGRPRLSANG